MKLRRPSTIAAASLLAGVSAGALFQYFGNAEATRRVEATLARLPGVHAGAISVNPWSGRIALTNLTVDGHGVRVSAGQAVLRASASAFPALISPAFAADETASADNVEINLGAGKIHIPHIEASGTTLTGDDLKEIVDPTSSLSITDRFDKLTADTITASEVTADIAAGQIVEKLAYSDIKLSDVSQGKIGSLTAGGGTVSISGPNMPGPAEGTIGAMSAKNLDLGLYGRILTQARTDPNEPLETLYDSAELDGMRLKAGDAFTLSVGKVSARGIKARPFMTSVNRFQEMMPKNPGDQPSPEQTKNLLAFISDIYNSLEIGTAEINDIGFQTNQGGKAVSLGFKRFGFSGVANARLGEMALDGLSVTAPDVHVGVGAFAIRGFNFKPTLDSAQKLELGEPNPIKNVNPRTLLPTIDQIVLAGIDADVPDDRHQGNVADRTRDKFKIGKIQYDGSNFQLGIPTTISLAIENVVADLPASDANVRQLIELGYPSVDISSKLALAWNEAANELGLKELSIKGAGMGAFAVKGAFGNVTKDLFTGDLAVAQAALLGAVIKEVDLRVDDAGLFNKALAYSAKMSNKTPDQMRKEAIAGAAIGIPQALGNTPAAKAVGDAVAKFIAQPKSLEIDAKSADGLGAADFPLLSDPVTLLGKLKVTATAN